MKKYIFTAALAAIATTGFTQVKFAPQVSASLGTAGIDPGEAIDFKQSPVAGFAVGLLAEIPVTEKFSIRPSINLAHKGVTLKGTDQADGGIGTVDVKITNNLYYAELPVVATFNVPLQNSKLFFGAGPSLGVGLFGKSKATYTLNFSGLPPESETMKSDAFEDDGAGFKRVDLSANAIAGIQWNSGLYVNASYLHGFSNLIADEDDGSYKNRTVQLTVGFLLGKK